MTDKKGKVSEAQKRASRAYEERNPEKTKIDRYRRNAKTFFRHHATKDDIDELIDIYYKENPRGIKEKEDWVSSYNSVGTPRFKPIKL